MASSLLASSPSSSRCSSSMSTSTTSSVAAASAAIPASMKEVLAVDVVASADKAKWHLESRRPAVLIVLRDHCERPVGKVAGYKVIRSANAANTGLSVYTRSDVANVSPTSNLAPSVAASSCSFDAIWIKIGRHRDDSEDVTQLILGAVVNDVGGRDNVARNAFRDYVSNALNGHARKQMCPDAKVLLIGDFGLANEQDVSFFSSAFPGTELKTFMSADQTAVSYLRSSGELAAAAVQSVLSSSGLTTRLTRFHCPLCKVSLAGKVEAEEHKNTVRHKKNRFYKMYKDNRSELVSSKHGIKFALFTHPESDSRISLDADAGVLRIERNQSEEESKEPITILVRNDNAEESGVEVVLRTIRFVTDSDGFSLSDKYMVTKDEELRPPNLRPGVKLVPQRRLKVQLSVKKRAEVGTYLAPIIAYLRRNDRNEWTIMMLEVALKVVTPLMAGIAATAPYQKPTPIKNFRTGKVEPGLRPQIGGGATKKATKKRPLAQYPMKDALKAVFYAGPNSGDPRTVVGAEGVKLTPAQYAERMQFLLWAEEHQMNVDITNYDMKDVAMTTDGRGFLYLDVPGLAENRPSVLQGDTLLASPSNGSGTYEGFVHEVQETQVKLGFSRKLVNTFVRGMRFNIRFVFNRFPLRNMHRAVETMVKNGVQDAVFPYVDKNDASLSSPPTTKAPRPPKGFVNRAIENNAEQAEAVCRIIQDNNSSHSIPYIVFGPPGTGKTVTVVEAIKQLYKSGGKDGHILACAPSNSAADLIAIRLLDTVAKSDLMRLYAPSRHERQVPAELLEVSNFAAKRSHLLVQDMKPFRVLVTTLVTAGRLVTYGFEAGHFSHLFIDEAGHAVEPEAVIPVAGLMAREAANKTKVVLAGDPKQLGPIVRSAIAVNGGLATSLLERLMSDQKCKVYQRDPVTGRYDARFITKLLDNFRSHASLLSLPSRMFYQDELRSKGDPVVTGQFLRWDCLPKVGFPMIFHAVAGKDQREARSPSFFNPQEVQIVVEYVVKLFQKRQGIVMKGKDVGIISPYQRQVRKIHELLNTYKQKGLIAEENFKGITVGSTEQFQGQERRVIIISTVRSSDEFLQSDYKHRLGFLRNPKRFNVAITRPKALLVVIGNPLLLCQDPHWKELIKYAHDNKGYTGGVPYPDEASVDAKLTAVQKMFGMMGVSSSSSDDADEERITEMELQEAPEWRADF